jgi:hypothetical protein
MECGIRVALRELHMRGSQFRRSASLEGEEKR